MREKLLKTHCDLLDLNYAIGKLRNQAAFAGYTSYMLDFLYESIAGIDKDICWIIGELQENERKEKERNNGRKKNVCKNDNRQ